MCDARIGSLLFRHKDTRNGGLVPEHGFRFGTNVGDSDSTDASGPVSISSSVAPVDSAAPTSCAAGMVPSRIRIA